MPKGEKSSISMLSGICKGRAQAYPILLSFHLSIMLVLLSSILLNFVLCGTSLSVV
jgi:hypothetical protein